MLVPVVLVCDRVVQKRVYVTVRRFIIYIAVQLCPLFCYNIGTEVSFARHTLLFVPTLI